LLCEKKNAIKSEVKVSKLAKCLLPLLGDNINIIKKDKEALLEASMEVGLEVNAKKAKYMVVSCQQNAV
jgi:hypothetical protein